MVGYVCTLILLFLSIVLTVYLIIVTFWHCRSEKRNYFVLCLLTVFLYLVGYFCELTAFSVGGALVAVKFMYLGSCFLPALCLFLVIDYCDFELRVKYLKPLILLLPVAGLSIVWTTEYTGWMYAGYHFDAEQPLLGLQIDEGPLYYFIYSYSTVYITVGCAILIRTLLQRREQFKSLLLLFAVLVAPLVANGMYILCTVTFHTPLRNINFTPYAIIAAVALFYVNIMRYDLFDIVPMAYSMTLDYIRDAFVIVNPDMKYMGSNKAARRLFPDLESLRRGAAVTQVANWPDELLYIADYSEDLGMRFVQTDKDGEERYFSAQIDAIFVTKKQRLLGWIILIQDITSSIGMMKKLEQAAYTDALTGLYNRRHFMELASMQFERTKRSGGACHVMMMDLDFFKNINDTYGHPAGDAVLRNVSACIKETVRSYDLVTRYGGEEFVVMITDSDEDTALRLAERIRTRVEGNPCRYEDKILPITFSIGIASGKEVDSFETLLRYADDAMYAAKRKGRNRVEVHRGKRPKKVHADAK
ncbi:MAG: diguanylate cyclase [Clostridiales Family XIII bacterium]|nr:diguanylate cyclase [Clostridiales Family XIII bacterium]